ncbi:unnamed protein product [Didymodactylos carnosus]|uniref:Tubulin-folding cofactor B n=1 Tax=Didymodactylos carnosus TaxID=1234261 RepID=A0A8S2CSW8_9BILA|nr:unnamed protein product [Didymodactylos carnosus]CAF3578421.1 unnamed protein product [Didymodactylos carnosus]
MWYPALIATLDVVPDIRCLCMSELGEWMKNYPMVFLDDIYLKYIGWTLYDKVGDCRLRCLLALIPLFSTTDLVGKLELFTNRFKDRIVQMTVDCEYEVAVQAIKLLTAILKFNERILEDKDCENIYELVYHSHRQVAQAAGEFLNQKLFHKAEIPLSSSTQTKKRSQNTSFMHLLVQFFIESELHEHATYLVDSMWDLHPMMKDWECMTDILLEEPDQDDEPLDDQHENCLIEILVCCVKEAATGEYPIGRGQPNRKLNMKEQKQKEDDKKILTEHFIGTLPPLLNKYIADGDKLLNLLQIPLHFNYETYTTTRRERDLDTYLGALNDIVQRHTTAEIFDAVSKCFECVCDVIFTLSNRAIAYRGNITDKIVANFIAAMNIFEDMDEADEDDLYPLLLNLRKLDAFHQCHDLGATDLWDKIHLLFKAAIDNEDMSPEIVEKCFGVANRTILWGLVHLETQFDRDLLKKIVKRSRKLSGLCQKLMLHSNQQICQYAYSTLCDLLISLSPHLIDKNDEYKSLVLDINENLIQTLLTFLSTYVFNVDEPKDQEEQVKIEALHKKRNLLAAYCKLIVHNVLPIQASTNILKYYVKYNNDFGDIIKNTFTRARDISKIHTAKTMAHSLIAVYCLTHRDQQLASLPNDEERTIPVDLSPLRELARRFNLSFGLDMGKQREALAALHRECIRFGVTPLTDPIDSTMPGPNVLFLECLPEFTSKLFKPDKKAIYDYLEKLVNNVVISDSDAWEPLIQYRRVLMDEGVAGGHTKDSRARSSTAARGRKRVHEVSAIDELSRIYFASMASGGGADMIEFTIKSNVVSSEAIRRFKRSMPVHELRNQLELITGAQASTMKIHVKDERGTELFDLNDDSRTLGSYDVHPKMVLSVEDTNDNSSHLFDDTSSVPKYELSQEEYASRQGTARQFLQENKIGRFNPEAERQKEEKEKQKEENEKRLATKIKISDRCEVAVVNQPTKRGTVMYIGEVHFKPGVWIGIKYDEPLGKNDGSVDGKVYFQCQNKYGAFVRPSSVKVGDFPEIDLEEL